MGRYARINYPNLIYHVINRGNNREIIFAEDEDYQHYLNTIQRYKKKYHFKLYAYCLMTNHVHLLIQVSKEGSISKIMQSVTVAHTRRYNYKYQRCGHVWQGRFHSPIVSEDDHMLTIMQYIEQNPLRANMVKCVTDYPWSSYKLNVRKKEPVIINRAENKVFHNLGDDLSKRIYNYKKKMKEMVKEKQLEKIHHSTRRDGHYISDKFKGQISAILPRKRQRGRPTSRKLSFML
ncbi:MAG: REP-associated tyrosine transposase [Candidatus Anammoxibacter sp.]